MQARHNFGPENGPQNTVISSQKSLTTTFSPSKTRNSRTEGSNLSSDLVEGLRCRAGRHGNLSIDAGGTL